MKLCSNTTWRLMSFVYNRISTGICSSVNCFLSKTMAAESNCFSDSFASRSICIDGSILEGGGQILRIALSTSVLMGQPISIRKIRAGRTKGGLAAQHLKGVELVQQLCRGAVEGAYLGSKTILFEPGKICSGHYTADTRTAGSVALLFQVAYPCCVFSDGVTHLTLRGGTNAPFAPQIDYMINVFKPMVSYFGAELDMEVRRRGFLPAGKGEVTVRIPPHRQLKAATILDFGEVELIAGEAFVAGKIPPSVADEMALSAKNILRVHTRNPVNVRVNRLTRDEAFGNGWGINLYARTSTGCVIGSSGLGRPGLQGEEVGRLAAEELANSIRRRACVDGYLQDQLVIFMALAAGNSSIRTLPLTLHTETAIEIISRMTDAKFNVREEQNICFIDCEGIGFTNKSEMWRSTM